MLTVKQREALTAELAKPAYAGMTAEQVRQSLVEQNETRTVSRFANLRTLAAILTVEEYATVRTILDAVAAQQDAVGIVVGDMLAMLKLPGDDRGNGGGIDMGAATTRAMVSQLFAAVPSAAQKMLTYAEKPCSPQQRLGLGQISVEDVASCMGVA